VVDEPVVGNDCEAQREGPTSSTESGASDYVVAVCFFFTMFIPRDAGEAVNMTTENASKIRRPFATGYSELLT
jgi:hypothetical protein